LAEWDENNLRAVFTNEDIFDALKDVIKSKNLLVGLGGSFKPNLQERDYISWILELIQKMMLRKWLKQT